MNIQQSQRSPGNTVLLAAAATFVCFVLFSPAMDHQVRAAIVTTGDVTPDPATTTYDDELTIGNTADGTMQIDGGSTVYAMKAYIGREAGVTGDVVVEGAGSLWDIDELDSNFDTLYVGRYGAGSLTIRDGGEVRNNYSWLGSQSGATGYVTVDGAGSKWDTSRIFIADQSGTSGSLEITNGGLVDASYVYVSRQGQGTIIFDNGTLTTFDLSANPSDLRGTGTINTSGLVADLDLVFDQENGLQQQIVLDDLPGQNVTINLEPYGLGEPPPFGDTFDALGAGWTGAGSLTVAEGVAVRSFGGVLGSGVGANGTANVVGEGSVWTITGFRWPHTYVGHQGTGTLNITDGGQVFVEGFSEVRVGSSPGSAGTVNVVGEGSTLTASLHLIVGYSGTGTLNVSDGGTVEVGGAVVVGSSGGGLGTMNISGSGTVDVKGPITLGAGAIPGIGTINLIDGVLRMHDEKFSVGTGVGTFNFISGRFEGAATVDLGTALVQRGGTLAPGTSAGTSTVEGGYTLEAGALEIEIDGLDTPGVNWDLLEVNGTVDLLGSDATADGVLDVVLGFAPTLSDEFLILQNDGVDAIIGEFASGSIVTAPFGAHLFEFAIDYAAGDGNDLALITQSMTLLGDFDLDNDVDGYDFLAWQSDPSVGALSDWEANYGMVAPLSTASAAVPEPSTWVLVLFGTIATHYLREKESRSRCVFLSAFSELYFNQFRRGDFSCHTTTTLLPCLPAANVLLLGDGSLDWPSSRLSCAPC